MGLGLIRKNAAKNEAGSGCPKSLKQVSKSTGKEENKRQDSFQNDARESKNDVSKPDCVPNQTSEDVESREHGE